MTKSRKGQVRTFTVSSLHLDLENPRFESTALNDSEAINFIINSKERNGLRKLARDIVEYGQLNPTELPIVVVEKGKKIVVEGNRRLACLKLLKKPGISSDIGIKRYFERLRDQGEIPEKIQATMFNSRGEADHWIFLRHTGFNEGVGVSDWSSAQTMRFKSRYTGKRVYRQAVIDYLSTEYFDDSDIQRSLDLIQSREITNLDRFFGSAYTKQILGLRFSQGLLYVGFDAEQLRPLLRAVLSQLAVRLVAGSGGWSRKLNRKEDKIAFLNEFSHLFPNLEQKKEEAVSVDDAASDFSQDPENDSDEPVTEYEYDSNDSRGPSEGESELNSDPSYKPPTPKNPPNNSTEVEKFLFSRVDFSGFGYRLNQLGGNAKTLEFNQKFDITGIVARVIVELCVDEFLKSHDLDLTGELWIKIKRTLLVLDPKAMDEKRARSEYFQIYRNIDKGQQGLAVRTMNAYLHDAFSTPGAVHLRHISGLFAPMLDAMSENLRSFDSSRSVG